VSVQRCSECGGLFANMPRGVCTGCLDQREQDFRLVRDWLRDNRGAGIAEATEATGVDEGIIVRFIREGRIEILGPSSEPALLRQREDEERRAELVRHLADVEQFGTSVRTDLDAPAPGVPALNNRSRGMRARRG
jgi:predicted  nucleic acid-binding Zn-ribbon protein